MPEIISPLGKCATTSPTFIHRRKVLSPENWDKELAINFEKWLLISTRSLSAHIPSSVPVIYSAPMCYLYYLWIWMWMIHFFAIYLKFCFWTFFPLLLFYLFIFFDPTAFLMSMIILFPFHCFLLQWSKKFRTAWVWIIYRSLCHYWYTLVPIC